MILSMFRRRPSIDESIESFNERLTIELARIPGFWGDGKGPNDVEREPDRYGDLSSIFLDCLKPGLSGQISYTGRFPAHMNEDSGQHDDWFELSPIELDKVAYDDFCGRIFPQLVDQFSAYRGFVRTNETLAVDDFDFTSRHWRNTGEELDGRQGVFRIWPVSFVDDLLCRRAFGMGAEEVVARAGPECEDAYLIDGGAFLLVSSEPIENRDELNALDARVKQRLGATPAMVMLAKGQA